MALNRRTRTIGVAAAIAALSGCQGLVPALPRAYVPTFRVEALPDGPAASAVRPDGAAAPIPVQAQGVTPATAGQLVVSFAHVLPLAAQRRLFATIADVDRVTITLSGNGVNHTETIPKAAIVNGQTTFTFSGLPAGTLTVTIKALNAAGSTIGQDVQQATVTAGQTTTVTSTVSLTPAVTAPRVIVSSSGGSGGGSSGNSGTLTTNVTLRDDVPVITPPLVAVHAPTSTTDPISEPIAYNVVLDHQDNAWFSGEFSFAPGTSRLGKVTPAGTLSYVDAPAGIEHWWFLGTNADRTRILLPVYIGVDQTTYGISTAGVAATAPAPFSDAIRLAQAADGSLYVADSGFDALTDHCGDLTRVAPDGTKTTIIDGDQGPQITSDVVVDHAGAPVAVVFLGGDPDAGTTDSYELRKYLPDGTLVFSRPYTGDLEHDVDSQNNVWVVDVRKRRLEKISPTGQLLGTFATPARCNKIFVDALDRVWTYQSVKMYFDRYMWNTAGGADDVISCFGPDGSLNAYYHVGVDADTEDLAVSADDHMWVASKAKGLIHLKLDPLP